MLEALIETVEEAIDALLNPTADEEAEEIAQLMQLGLLDLGGEG